MSAHHDRGFGDLDLFPSATFDEAMIPFVALELNHDSHPPRIRDLVLSEPPDFAIDKVTVLGVCGNHTRLLLPSAETTPAAWKIRRETADTVAANGWGGWESPSVTGPTRVQMALAPCVACDRHIRVPVRGANRYAGVAENWRGRWSPCSHPTAPSAQNNGSSRNGFPTGMTNDQSYAGRGSLSPFAAESLGRTCLPGCSHMWRSAGPCREDAVRYADDTAATFGKDELCSLAKKGDQLIRQCGVCTPLSRNFRK